MQSALLVYLTCDRDSRGSLVWATGEIQGFISQAFHGLGAHPPSEEQISYVLAGFDCHCVGTIDALECLCLFDALVRIAVCTETCDVPPAPPAARLAVESVSRIKPPGGYRPSLLNEGSQSSVATLLGSHSS